MNIIKNKLIGFGVITLTAVSLASCTQNGDSTSEMDVSSPPSISSQPENIIRVVNLTENQAAELNVATHFVEKDLLNYSITAPGVVVAAPEHIAIVSTPVNGRITTIHSHEGEEVIKGEPILEMESLEFADLAANYLEAQAEKVYLEQQVERLTALVERKISPQSSLDRATADLARADARIRASRARLQAVGIDNRQMEQWNTQSENESAVLTIYAPIDGKINHHLIDLGQAVNANDMLLDIVNNKQVLVRGYVDPEDIPFLNPGAKAIISQRSNRDEGRGAVSIESEITTIQPGLDEENKSIIVNSIVNTQNQWPVIGQSVRIEYEAATPDSVISVPISAIQFEGQSATVFVKRDDLTYENRPVRLQRMLRESAIVESGLSPGEEIAVSQIFSLKALGKFEEFAEE